MKNEYYPYVNLPLPYRYNALEPYIDETTMMLHHGSHLQAYIDKLNSLLEINPQLQKLSLEELIIGTDPGFRNMPDKMYNDIRHNAGGVYNHRRFFEGMEPNGLNRPYGRLSMAMAKEFENYDQFKKEFKDKALSIQGSGYVWLVADNESLNIITTANQITPIAFNLCPVLIFDVWEHAYYLKHYNKRADYVDDWLRVINWYQAEKKLP